MIELLSPGGDFQKIKTAVNYGADAVYAGLKRFSLRSNAGNLDDNELKESIKFVHKNHKKIYITLNTFLFDNEFGEFIKVLKLLNYCRPDAIILSDLGALEAANEILDIPIHISTQANITNSHAAKLLKNFGVKRIVAAREMSLNDIKNFTQNSDMELELFVHGAMCMAYSGRCFMSSCMAERSANKGDCTQSCRWSYEIVEEKRPNLPMSVEEDKTGTFIFNSYDLCALPILDKLIDAGVKSLKIEGRMKSSYYAALTTAVYRKAIDAILNGENFHSKINFFLEELEKISHRPYSLGFFENEPLQYRKSSKYMRGSEFIAVTQKIENNKIFLKLKGQIKPGVYQFLTRKFEIITINIDKLYTIDGEEKAIGNPNDLLYIHSNIKVEKLDILRKIT